MNKNFKSNERELINVVNYFKRKSKQMIASGAIDEQHRSIQETVDRFVEQINMHADQRAAILEQRKILEKIVRDDPSCPKCHSKDMIKLVGTEKNDKGWKSNRYKCRKCNIQFTWNTPNNPWDLLEYIQAKMIQIEEKLATSATEDEKNLLVESLDNTKSQLERIKPIISAHDAEYLEMTNRDDEMEKLIHEFKNSLLIEKIKMDTWESKTKSRNK
ncbi:MAG: hypothetical protein ABIS36_15350 [Chryseolinea sp.]